MNRILIINDSKFESMILSDLLSQIGYNSKITDEYDALKQIQSFAPDIVMVNYIMKDTRGDKLIQLIKSKHPDLLCVLSSNNKLDVSELRTHNVDAFIRTPVNKHNLSSTLEELKSKDKNKADFDIAEEKEVSSIRARLESWKQKTNIEVPVSEGHEEHGPESKSKTEAAAANEDSNYSFCPYCGGKLMERDSGFAFCPLCGHKL